MRKKWKSVSVPAAMTVAGSFVVGAYYYRYYYIMTFGDTYISHARIILLLRHGRRRVYSYKKQNENTNTKFTLASLSLSLCLSRSPAQNALRKIIPTVTSSV